MAANAVASVGDSVAVINEVHYHPEGLMEDTEFVELHNQLSVNVDLSGWKLDGAVEFIFPEGSVIPRRGYLVVARNPAALQTASGYSAALGPYEGALDNDGETLRLYNNNSALRTRPDGGGGEPVEQLVATWRLGEDDPGALAGATGNSVTTGVDGGWNLGRNGTPSYSATVPSGSTVSMQFDGAGNYSAPTQVTATDNIVMECWARPTALGSGGFSFAVSNGAVGNGGYGIVEIAGRWRIIHNGVEANRSGPLVELNTWTHLRFVRFEGVSQLFVDGVVGGSSLSSTPSEPDLFHIGANTVSAGFEGEFTGQIDGVRIFELSSDTSPGSFDLTLDRRRLMDELRYKDDGAWPITPDGSGFSLAKIDPQLGNSVSNWAWSLEEHGTPGSANFPTPPALWNGSLPTVSFNEVSGANDAGFRLELVNHGPGSVNLTGWEIVVPETASIHALSGTLNAGAFLDLDDIELGFRPADNDRLFLYTPGRAQITDAIRIARSPRAREEDGTGRWLEPTTTTFGSANAVPLNNTIVINEILYEPFDNGSEQWIELKNRGTDDVNLGGWSLSEAVSYTFEPDTMLGAGQLLVVAADSAALLAKYPGRRIAGDWSRSLSDEGERIVLEDALGNPVDEVEYGTRLRWPERADRGGSSLELRDADSDNSQPEAWAASDSSHLGRWQTISYTEVATDDGIGNDAFHDFLLGMLSAGEILIDDVSVRENPTSSNIEFIQNGDFESDALGSVPDKWRCIGNHGEGNSVVVTDPDDPANKCLRVLATGNIDDKHNRIETTFDNNERVVVGRTYRITFRARWMGGSNQVNTRLYFNYLQRTNLLEVGDAWGTPGQENSTAVANAGPTAEQLRHSPTVPDAGQPVTVSAKLHDADGIGRARLFYRVNNGVWRRITMSQGTDGRHSAVIPGQSFAATVQFYILVDDALGVFSSFPAAGEDSGCFYKVDDNNADSTGRRTNFRVLVSPENASRLFVSTNRMSNALIPCTVIEDERIVYYHAMMRLHGSASGRYGSDGVGYHIVFSDDRRFRGIHPTLNIDRHSAFREVLAKHMLNRAGGAYWSHFDDVGKIVGPSVNGIGLIAAARTSRQFVKSLFPNSPTGTVYNHELLYQPNSTTNGHPESLKVNNPYNHTRGRYDLEDRGPDKEAYRWGWQIRSKRREDDYSKMVRFNQAFSLTGSAFEQEIEAVIDVDQFMRTWAMMALYGNDDQFGRLWEHNWRLYERPSDGKLIALPWDLDRAFRLSTSSQLTPTNDEIQRLFAVPKWKRLFDSHLLDMTMTTANSEYLDSWASHLGAAVGTSLSSYADYADDRGDYALTQMPPDVHFEITTNGGASFSTPDSNVTLSGRAWVDVYYIFRQGESVPIPIAWTDGETWSINLPIAPGANVITLVGKDQRFNDTGTDSITITGTGLVVPAGPDNLVFSEIHYHPADPSAVETSAGFSSDDDFEFFELFNISDTLTIDLTGVHFGSGLTYALPTGMEMAPGERLVVPRRAAAFALRYPGVATAPEYYIDTEPDGNKLSNGGESITLLTAGGTPIKDFSYSDDAPWPESADGAGPSLILIRPKTNPDHDNSITWRASLAPGGNPGSDDSVIFVGEPDNDLDRDGIPALIEHAIGTSDSFRSGEPFSFSTENGLLTMAVQVSNLVDDVTLVFETSSDLETWTEASPETFTVTAFDNGDGTSTFTYTSTADFIANNPRRFLRLWATLLP